MQNEATRHHKAQVKIIELAINISANMYNIEVPYSAYYTSTHTCYRPFQSKKYQHQQQIKKNEKYKVHT